MNCEWGTTKHIMLPTLLLTLLPPKLPTALLTSLYTRKIRYKGNVTLQHGTSLRPNMNFNQVGC